MMLPFGRRDQRALYYHLRSMVTLFMLSSLRRYERYEVMSRAQNDN